MLPFVLRREKTEVLADLPPKIITEMVCDLTPEQRRLHSMWERGGKCFDYARDRRSAWFSNSWRWYARLTLVSFQRVCKGSALKRAAGAVLAHNESRFGLGFLQTSVHSIQADKEYSCKLSACIAQVLTCAMLRCAALRCACCRCDAADVGNAARISCGRCGHTGDGARVLAAVAEAEAAEAARMRKVATATAPLAVGGDAEPEVAADADDAAVTTASAPTPSSPPSRSSAALASGRAAAGDAAAGDADPATAAAAAAGTGPRPPALPPPPPAARLSVWAQVTEVYLSGVPDVENARASERKNKTRPPPPPSSCLLQYRQCVYTNGRGAARVERPSRRLSRVL